MFGTYRTFLALCVVVTHLLKAGALGGHAVHGFFILSGYLMTLIMEKSYGYGLKGFSAFVFNRFLRLYPTYWIIFSLSVIAIIYFGETEARSYHPAIYLPSTTTEWLQSLTMVYANLVPITVGPRVAPPTWALTLELTFYLLIALGLSRTKRITLAWFSASVLYTLATYFFDHGADYRYIYIASASLPFSIGAITYHHRERIRESLLAVSNCKTLRLLLICFVVNSLVSSASTYLGWPSGIVSICQYLNMAINVLVIGILLNKPALPVSEATDKKIGDYSYPLYLCHWQAGMLVSLSLFHRAERGPTFKGLVCFLGALVVCGIVSFMIIQFVEKPIENYRAKVRRRAREALTNH